MKKVISILFILLISNIGISQFSRTYNYFMTTSESYFSNYLHFSKDNKTLLTNMYVSSNYELTLTTQEIDNQGEVIRIKKNVYTDPLFVFNESKNNINSITGIFDYKSNRYYVLTIEYENGIKLVWLKTNIETGNLLEIYFSEEKLKIGYSETKLIGEEMVSYYYYGYKLKRFAMPINDFGNLSIEETASPNDFSADIRKGQQLGTLLVIDNLEYYVDNEAYNDYRINIIRRDAKDEYTKLDVTPNYLFKTTKSSTAFVNDDNYIVITDGNRFNVLKRNGVLKETFDLEMNFPHYFTRNLVFYKDQKYYVVHNTEEKSSATLVVLDKEFNKLEQKETKVIHATKFVEHNDKFYLLGNIGVPFKYSQSHTGKRIRGDIAYVESFEEMPKVWYDEYFKTFQFENSDLNLILGLGTQVFANEYYNYPSIRFQNSESIALKIADNYLGINTDGALFGNVSGYKAITSSEIPGPCTNNEDYDEVEEAKYNRPYYVNRKMIADHLDSLKNGSSNYVPPWSIKNWPGNGNTSIGQAHKLADFFDNNKNGIYEPMQGDYPIIYGDECVFSITHYWDEGDKNLWLEFHSYIYKFDCDTTEDFRNALFRKLNIISRGADLDNFYLGVYQDGNLNEQYLDFVGTHVDLGMTYFYNAQPVNTWGFKRLSSIGTLILKGFKQDDDGIDNNFGIEENESINGLGFGDGIVDNEYLGLVYSVPSGIPENFDEEVDNNFVLPTLPEEKYLNWKNNFMGLTRSGDSFTYGGTGIGGTLPTKYAFPWINDTHQFGTNGETPPFEGWSELNTDGNDTQNEYGDRRILASLGETYLNRGDVISIDYAVLTVKDAALSTSITAPLDLLFENGEIVRNAYINNSVPCDKNFHNVYEPNWPFETDDVVIFPNPTTSLIRIVGLTEKNKINVYDATGALVKEMINHKEYDFIDLSNLRSGLYFFKMEDEKQSIVRKVIRI